MSRILAAVLTVLSIAALATTQATAQQKPDPAPGRAVFGAILTENSAQVRAATGIVYELGYVAVAVLPGSFAAEAGLQPGDLVIGVDGQPFAKGDPSPNPGANRVLNVQREDALLDIPFATRPLANDIWASRVYIPSNGYTALLPAGWRSAGQKGNVLTLEIADDASLADATVTIQNVLLTAGGGVHADGAALAESLKNQIRTGAGNATVTDGPAHVQRIPGLELTGPQFHAEFELNGVAFRQWTIVLPRPEGGIAHVWALTAPAAIFDAALVRAYPVLDGWQIVPRNNAHGPPQAAAPASGQYAGLIGKEYEQTLEIPGWNYTGGGLLDKSVWFETYDRPDRSQLYLSLWELPREQGSDYATFRVVDVLTIPPVSGDEYLAFDCQAPAGSAFEKIIAIVRPDYAKETEWWLDIARAWKVSLDTGKVSEASTRGVRCVNEGWGR